MSTKPNYREIQLTRGYKALVDEDDFELLSRYKWCAFISKGKYLTRVYAIRYEGWKPEKGIFMHRQILKFPEGKMVDHANGDGLDNRKENIRICSARENMFNLRKSRGASKYKGLKRSKSNKNPWEAYLKIDGKRKYLGCFRTENEAAEAYNKAAKKYFGEYARPNVISD